MLALAAFSLPAITSAQSDFDLRAAVAAARPGATIHVPAGIYPAPLVIDKPLTLIGEGMPTIQGDGTGDVVEINAPDVTLRGFVVRGSGDSLDAENAGITVGGKHVTIENNRVEDSLFGIYLHNAPDSVLRGNTVVGKDLPISRRGDGLKIWYSANTLVEDNSVHDSRDAVIWFSPGTTVRGNTMEHNRYGFHFMSDRRPSHRGQRSAPQFGRHLLDVRQQLHHPAQPDPRQSRAERLWTWPQGNQ